MWTYIPKNSFSSVAHEKFVWSKMFFMPTMQLVEMIINSTPKVWCYDKK
jgi:hypothetical protein